MFQHWTLEIPNKKNKIIFSDLNIIKQTKNKKVKGLTLICLIEFIWAFDPLLPREISLVVSLLTNSAPFYEMKCQIKIIYSHSRN